MTVKLLDAQELCGLWYDLGGDPDLKESLERVACGNRAAYMLSYGGLGINPDGTKHGDLDALVAAITLPTVDKPVELAGGWRPPAKTWVRNVAFNCVAKDGTDYGPHGALEALMIAALDVDSRERTASEDAKLARKAKDAQVFAEEAKP